MQILKQKWSFCELIGRHTGESPETVLKHSFNGVQVISLFLLTLLTILLCTPKMASR